MANLRFNRDKRGYETTALTEVGGRRRRGQRVLYFFRTPPSIRVGREAIDEEAMRLLERHNPDITFDWSRLLKQGAAGAAGSAGTSSPGFPGSREDRRRDRRDPRRPRYEQPPAAATAPAASATAADETEQTHFSVSEPAADTGAPVEALGAIEPPEPFERPERFDPEPALADPVEPVEPLQTGESAHTGQPVEGALTEAEPVEPRYERLGAEGLRRLRARYADVMGRIQATAAEAGNRAELEARAARLDPDGWQTDEDVASALEDYETVFESLRAVVGRHPRRKR